MLKSKREVFEKFVEWKALMERQSEHKIKVFRSDVLRSQEDHQEL